MPATEQSSGLPALLVHPGAKIKKKFKGIKEYKSKQKRPVWVGVGAFGALHAGVSAGSWQEPSPPSRHLWSPPPSVLRWNLLSSFPFLLLAPHSHTGHHPHSLPVPMVAMAL